MCCVGRRGKEGGSGWVVGGGGVGGGGSKGDCQSFLRGQAPLKCEEKKNVQVVTKSPEYHP